MWRRLSLLVLLLLLPSRPLWSQSPDLSRLEAFLDGLIRKRMERDGIPGAVIAVVRDGKVLLAKGYGYAHVADVAAKTPVDPESTVFLVGSVAKPVTATAVMQLVERGRLRLGEDVNRYLKDLQLQPAFPRPVTAAHLLTHTAGLDVSLIGTAAPDPAGVPTLGRYLAERLPPRIRPPGEIYSYSNHGYTLLGHLVEEVSGLPFDAYLERNVFRPLGMRRSGFTQPPDMAVGYEGSRLAPRVHPRIVPAAGLATTGTDMARFLIAHLEGERTGGILGAATFREMHRQHFTQDPRMPGMAYGFFESFENGQRTLFHGGGIRGYMSGIYLWPEHRLGLFVADNGYDGGLVWAVANGFLDHVFPVENKVPAPYAASARRCAGRYRLASQTRTTLEKAGALRDRDFLVRDLGDGALGIWGIRFVEIGPGLFRSVDTEEKVACREGPDGRILLVTEELFVGNQTWEQLPWTESAAFHRDALLALLALFLSGLALRPREEARLFETPVEAPPGARRAVQVGTLLSGLNLLFPVLMFVAFRQAAQGAGLLYGVPPLVTVALALPLIAAPLVPFLLALAARAWKEGWWSLRWRVHYTLLGLGGIAFLVFLHSWNLLGFRY